MVTYQTQADRKAALKAKEVKGNKNGTQKKKDSKLPTSLIFSLLALIIFFGGAVYFVLSIVNPFGNSGADKLTVPDLTGSII